MSIRTFRTRPVACLRQFFQLGGLAIASLLMAACHNGSGHHDPIALAPGVSIGGSVTGLPANASLTLENGDGNTVTVTGSGAFTFPQTTASGGSYSVTVLAQPTGLTCSVSNGTGTDVVANVSNVTVTCSALAFKIGGTVSGLTAGATVTLSDNGADLLTLSANGGFTFATPIAYDGSYAVVVTAQPAGETCSVSQGSGSGVTRAVGTVEVICATSSYSLSGTVSGLGAGQSVTIADNGANATRLTSNGAFSLPGVIAYNGSYSVTVTTQPVGETCSVTSGSGSKVEANVSGVAVVCATDTYTVSGTLSGLSAGVQVTLTNNGGDPLTLKGNGGFTFDTAVAYDGSYAVAVGTQPNGETCSVANGTGAALEANVTNVAVTCQAKPQFAYISLGTGQVAQYAMSSTGQLTALQPPTFSPSDDPFGIVFDPTGRFAYVSNLLTGTISQYSVNADGTLTALATPTVSVGGLPYLLAIDPTGHFLYAANEQNACVDELGINADGTLTPLTPLCVTFAGNPGAILIDPLARSVYALGGNSSYVAQFTIGSTGVLSQMTPNLVSAGLSAAGMVIDPTGHYAFVIDAAGDQVVQFTLGAQGQLNPVSGPGVPLAGSPTAVTMDHAGRFLYVADRTDGLIFEFSMSASGTLTAIGTFSLPKGMQPTGLAIDSTDQFMFVLGDSNTLYGLTIGSDGSLTALPAPTVTLPGSQPNQMVIGF